MRHVDFRSVAGEQGMTDYDRLCWEVVMPAVRAAVLRWDAMNPDPAVAFLEAWHGLLPAWMLNDLAEQLIMPKLQQGIEHWSADLSPGLHVFLHPWLPMLGESLRQLYPSVRNALAKFLDRWHPSSAAAQNLLTPWREPFGAKDFGRFVTMTVAPKLALLMRNFTVNPADQTLEPFTWTLAWMDLLPTPALVEVLEQHFFSKFLTVLAGWLAARPDYSELLAWYEGWKSLLPPPLARHPAITQQLHIALSLIELALIDPTTTPDLALATQATKRVFADAQPAAQMGPSVSSAATFSLDNDLNMRDLIQSMAAQTGTVFVPKDGRTTADGKVLYTLGDHTVYIDNNVIFMRTPSNTYQPTSLDQLLAQQ